MIKKNIATNELGFVFNPATGDSYSTNPIAAAIIQMMKEGKSLNEIKRSLFAMYDTDKSTIEKDLNEFINTLKENNLLTS
ncbi:MAG: PqqD family protein [Sphingobacteriales bacterium]|nr:PqqD family protein [Sphingobacteriales bacterium]